MIAVPFILFALAAAMTIIGLRGRTIGDEPRCRRCDFDLRGRDASISNPRCPECGSDLSDPAASVRIGVHHRRPILLSMGIVMLIQTCITLTKTVRDNHESSRLVNRIEDAKAERLLMEVSKAA